MKLLLRISAVFLWYFVALFLILFADHHGAVEVLTPGSTITRVLLREPYQWDYEMMFAGLFLVWGSFSWGASTKPDWRHPFLKFTAWGFLVHAGTMLLIGALRPPLLSHMVLDSLPWLVLSLALFGAALRGPAVTIYDI